MKYDAKQELTNLINHLLDLKNISKNDNVDEYTKKTFKTLNSMADNILSDISKLNIDHEEPQQVSLILAKICAMYFYIENYYKKSYT